MSKVNFVHSKFSAAEKWYEADREVKMRIKVYAKLNNGKPMTKAQELQIARMQDIADDYKRLQILQNHERLPIHDCRKLWAQHSDYVTDVGPQPDPNAVPEHMLKTEPTAEQMSLLEQIEEASKRG